MDSFRILGNEPMDKAILKSLLPNEIFALTIYGEARGEPIEGQVAVGCVIRNRLQNNLKKYKNYADVCLEPKQFSCWNDDDPNRQRLLDFGARISDNSLVLNKFLKQCYLVANGVIGNAIMDNTRGARFYMESRLFNTKRPSWAKLATNVRVIGHHTFFSLN